MKKLEVSEDWMSGYRAGLERAAEIVQLIRPRYAEAFVRDELVEAVVRGCVADRGECPVIRNRP